jgi:hypothetical protein
LTPYPPDFLRYCHFPVGIGEADVAVPISWEVEKGEQFLSSKVAVATLRSKSMRTYVLAMFTAALFALPTSAAFSQVDVEIGSGGVRVGPGYHRHLYNRSDEGRCQELRQACVHKEQLGEEGSDRKCLWI